MTSEEEIVELVRDVQRVVRSVHATDTDRAVAAEHLRGARDLLGTGDPRERSRRLSTFSGDLNPVAPPMRIRNGTLADGRPALLAEVRLDLQREGPPQSVHGGVLAGMFDELMGGAQRLNGGLAGMTGRLTVRYRRPTPLNEDLLLRAWIHDERKRRVAVRADCSVATAAGLGPERSAITAEAEAFFIRVDFERLDDIMRSRAGGETPQPAPGRTNE
ncbi:MAG: acyl-coenzyme A thioesterase PaaI-like protein [Candidatus Aldehydirespiratoraceae bacterium]|jgi:acyl-coenzyme A thioesterase PaaI-like protein